jgi:glucose-1-phosphate thymidylyltransferase
MSTTKGIILAGGTGSRLWPLTVVTSKHLLPIYDKPLIYYPLTTLMLAGIRDFLVVTSPGERERFESLLGCGRNWGISIQYAVQSRPNGIAEAFLIAERFLDGHSCALILGDNIFYGAGLSSLLQKASVCCDGATVFCYWVDNPGRYGVLELGAAGTPLRIEEKPKVPPSNWAVTGLYLYEPAVVEVARKLKPSIRGELEITDINAAYLKVGRLRVERFGRGFAWFDAGTHNSLLEASEFIHTIEERQGLKIGCPEEIAYHMGFISAAELEQLIDSIGTNDYGNYLRRVINSRP